MSTKTNAIKKVYVQLTTEEKKEVIEFVNSYENSTSFARQAMNEALNKLGPRDSSGCPVCGK